MKDILGSTERLAEEEGVSFAYSPSNGGDGARLVLVATGPTAHRLYPLVSALYRLARKEPS